MRILLTLAVAACLAAPVTGQSLPASPKETASQFYLRYRAFVPTATTIQQVVEFWSSDQRQDFHAAPADQRPDLAFVKSLFATTTNVTVVKESATANFATLDVQGVRDGKPVTATIDLVREKEAWKIASGPERWQ
jgi:hypothetical protein